MSLRLSLSAVLTAVFLRAAAAQRPPFACDAADGRTKSLPFCDAKMPIHRRVQDLVSRLTLDEKISQLVNSAPAIPRLGIPAYEWWSEALHGVSGYGRGISYQGRVSTATSFPQVILAASTFDAQLWYRIGQAIGKEARAMYNEGQAKGLTFWAPNINIYRDPRWGRGQETPGEDPLVAGKYAVAFVRGFQGDVFEGGKLGNGHLQASACCKHFTAYDLDKWKGVDRLGFDARVTAQDLADTYQPPFERCIKDGKASGIMCAYNRVNGIPNCADYNLLTVTARRNWGFNGYITSDCDAVLAIHDYHKYARLREDAVADVLKAGMDVECGSYLKNYTKSAIAQKKLPVADLDRALRNQFAVRMRLGLFTGNPAGALFGNLKAAEVCSPAHQQLALDAARNGIVLLKNSGRLLPLSKSRTPSVAVIGPNADDAYTLRGNYDGPPCKTLSILNAIKSHAAQTLYSKGCDNVACANPDINGAVAVAKRAEYVVLVMGLDTTQETEDRDREELTLPGQQEALVRAVSAAAKRPVVLVLVCGSPVDVSFAKFDPKIGGMLWAGYPGEAGGIALSEIVFGLHNPGGKLPVTWYPKEFVSIPMTDMRMRPDSATRYPGRTYRFYNGPKVFEYGYGLSYTTYSYNFIHSTLNTVVRLNRLMVTTSKVASNETSESLLRHIAVSEVGAEGCERARLSMSIRVENTGSAGGRHPVLLFARDGRRGMKKLVGFESVALEAGETREVSFEVRPCEHLSKAMEDGTMVMEKGEVFFVVEDEEYPVNIVF
ncbi:probable beta-D-xylosidase 7 [Andrographis paniculata]|uniref:probable beta-D-xylosidase 7 n=1 Tax=Andrographis paniculata TaxID=175694 RepID=UPI0021E6EF8C|nr:probable beta-D-xylosidase 7 [Andrographis paniculata]